MLANDSASICKIVDICFDFFFQAEDGIRDDLVTGVQTCALPISGCALAQVPGIEEIMARVAESQAKSLDARRAYVYDQDELLRMHRTGGRLVREEIGRASCRERV